MEYRSHKRSGTVASLALFMLLTFAVGAQAAFAAQAPTPPAGHEGRGGASLSAVTVTQPAETDGRGGATAAQPEPAPGPLAEAFVSRARGGYPAAAAAVGGTSGVTPASSASAGWIAAGLVTAALVLISGFFAWAGNRRRVWQRQSTLASYCTYHPADSIC